MNQYKQQPYLFQKRTTPQSVKQINEMVEIDINNQRTYVPSAEAYQRLVKRVAVLEQRLQTAENKASRALGVASER